MNKLLLVIERDVRLFFQYKFLIILRAIWFISQIALFGLIASRMVNIPTGTLAPTKNIPLGSYQQYTFPIVTPSNLDNLVIDVFSSQGHGVFYVYDPKGVLMATEHFDWSNNVRSFHLDFPDPAAGSWSVRLVSNLYADDYSIDAYSAQIDYFRYYVAGLSVMTLYSAAVFIGFDIYEEAEHGVFEYLLSLPVSRRQLVLGRSIGGGLRSFIYVGPLICLSLYVIGSVNPLGLLVSLLSLFLFAFGVSGMTITIAVVIKSSDRFDILMGVMNALIVRLSTAMYPLAVIQASNPVYGRIANFNPITYVSDLFRWSTNIITLDNPLLPLLGIVVFFAFFTFVGVVIYDRRIEGGGWR
jgi:ABC-type multidrug transport system permease subunit